MSAVPVTIVDYEVGNLKSIERAIAAVGGTARFASTPDAIRDAGHLVLPGVGAFGDCVDMFRKRQLDTATLMHIKAGKPLLGICVGMQMLFEIGEEFGEHKGLAVLPGRVQAIPAVGEDGIANKIPHIGWTALERPREASADRWRGTLLDGMPERTMVYFVHSFTAVPGNASDRLADAYYGSHRLAGAVARDNVCGTQFHPEKSGRAGLAMLAAFINGKEGR